MSFLDSTRSMAKRTWKAQKGSTCKSPTLLPLHGIGRTHAYSSRPHAARHYCLLGPTRQSSLPILGSDTQLDDEEKCDGGACYDHEQAEASSLHEPDDVIQRVLERRQRSKETPLSQKWFKDKQKTITPSQ
jgi:hypothetical protein